MNIVFEGIEHVLALEPGFPAVLEIANKTLFARICRSLLAGNGEEALEPYSLWDEDGRQMRPSSALLVVSDPLSLPWDHRLLVGKCFGIIEDLSMEDECDRSKINQLGNDLMHAIAQLTHRVHGDYHFA